MNVKKTLSIPEEIDKAIRLLASELGINHSQVIEKGVLRLINDTSAEEKLKDLQRKLEDNTQERKKIEEEIEKTKKVVENRGSFKAIETNLLELQSTYQAKKLKAGYEQAVLRWCKEEAITHKKTPEELLLICQEKAKKIELTEEDLDSLERSYGKPDKKPIKK